MRNLWFYDGVSVCSETALSTEFVLDPPFGPLLGPPMNVQGGLPVVQCSLITFAAVGHIS